MKTIAAVLLCILSAPMLCGPADAGLFFGPNVRVEHHHYAAPAVTVRSEIGLGAAAESAILNSRRVRIKARHVRPRSTTIIIERN